MPVTGEDLAAITARTTLGQAYTQAITDIQNLWVSTYTSAYNKQSDAISHISESATAELAIAQRQLKHLKDNMQKPPSHDLDVTTINNRAQASAAKVLPLFGRSPSERADFWQGLFTADVFASFFKESRGVVDLR
jgi:hypothetical protein